LTPAKIPTNPISVIMVKILSVVIVKVGVGVVGGLSYRRPWPHLPVSIIRTGAVVADAGIGRLAEDVAAGVG